MQTKTIGDTKRFFKKRVSTCHIHLGKEPNQELQQLQIHLRVHLQPNSTCQKHSSGRSKFLKQTCAQLGEIMI